MTRFEYVSIFNGIIVALAIENVAASFHKLLEAGKRVRWHWMAPTNAIGSAISTLGAFWLWWLARDVSYPYATVLTFLPGALAAVFLYLVCAATLPDDVPAEGIDLEKFYFSSCGQFWGLVALTLVLRECVEVWSLVRMHFDPRLVHLDTPFLAGTVVAIGIAGTLAFVRMVWLHAIGIVAMTAGVLFLFGSLKLPSG